jgi:hypothetical protein
MTILVRAEPGGGAPNPALGFLLPHVRRVLSPRLGGSTLVDYDRT